MKKSISQLLGTRRQLLLAGASMGACLLVRPALATPEELSAALKAYAGGSPIRPGRVKLDIAPLVDNGNTVPLAVSVDSPMTASDHVVAIAVFNERNPQREVIKLTLGPRAGRATV
ncbi:MAG: thiosulfate oxidation carrier protein SoxY, partial [Hylemonella sp.]